MARCAWLFAALFLAVEIAVLRLPSQGLRVDIRVDGDGAAPRYTQIDRWPGLRVPEAAHVLPQEQFEVRWRGAMRVPVSGVYGLELKGSGKAYMRLDDVVVLQGGGAAGTELHAEQHLDTGDHVVEIAARPTRQLSMTAGVRRPGNRFAEPLPPAWLTPHGFAPRPGWVELLAATGGPLTAGFGALATGAWLLLRHGDRGGRHGPELGLSRKLLYSALALAPLLCLGEGVARLGVRTFPVLGADQSAEDQKLAAFVARRVPTAARRPEALRIFAFGGSTVVGVPYREGGMVDWLRVMLTAYLPRREIEIGNLARPGEGSDLVSVAMPVSLAYQPDLVLIYSGHNEFYRNNRPTSRSALQVRGMLARSAAFSLFRRLLLYCCADALLNTSGAPERTSAAEIGAILRQYEENLGTAVAAATGAGVPVLLATVVSNDRMPPRGSISPPGCSRRDLESWQEARAAAEDARERRDFGGAVEHLRQARALQPGHAETTFALAQAVEAVGRVEEARDIYGQARDEDGVVIRAVSGINPIVRRVAAAHGAVVADIEGLFRSHSPHGITGSELFSDFCHPNRAGYRLLAEELVRVIAERELLVPASEFQWSNDGPLRSFAARITGAGAGERRAAQEQ
ncbi:MAG: tetratricopeptide repeat protein [Candidatus Schekmanbacteria bacterium]|nr:tetratricopeptide repeat protein [Candidatus Schekmanbacteria bacterium]